MLIMDNHGCYSWSDKISWKLISVTYNHMDVNHLGMLIMTPVGLWSTYLEQEPPLLGAGTLACFQHPPGGYTAPRVSARPMGSANLTTGLVRTLWLSDTDLYRAPVLKTSSKSGLPIAWITGYATIPQPICW